MVISEWLPFWGSLFGSVAGFVGVWLTLKSASKLQLKQLQHDAAERKTERQMSWRRDVYLSAAESISRLSALIGRLPDPSVPAEMLTSSYEEEISKVMKTFVIANEGSVASLNKFVAEYGSLYMRLQAERAFLLNIMARCQEVDAALKVVEQARSTAADALLHSPTQPPSQEHLVLAQRFGAYVKQSEEYMNQRHEISEELLDKQVKLYKAAMDASVEITPLVTNALLTIREELEMPLDGQQFAEQSIELARRFSKEAKDHLDRLRCIGQGQQP